MKTLFNSGGSIGIIGGANGPTAILVTYPDNWWMYVLGAAAVLAVVVLIFICKKRKQ